MAEEKKKNLQPSTPLN